MGIEYEDMLNLTWLEFDYYSTGYTRKLERGWDYIRLAVSGMYNSSGFSKKGVKPTDVMKLPNLDKVRRIVIEKVSPNKLQRMLKLMN